VNVRIRAESSRSAKANRNTAASRRSPRPISPFSESGHRESSKLQVAVASEADIHCREFSNAAR
jgi:hypothetical protein